MWFLILLLIDSRSTQHTKQFTKLNKQFSFIAIIENQVLLKLLFSKILEPLLEHLTKILKKTINNFEILDLDCKLWIFENLNIF